MDIKFAVKILETNGFNNKGWTRQFDNGNVVNVIIQDGLAVIRETDKIGLPIAESTKCLVDDDSVCSESDDFADFIRMIIHENAEQNA